MPVKSWPRSLRRRLRRLFLDDGMTIVEVSVATMVAAIAITGVIGTMTSGFSLVGQARQRSSGTDVAQQAIEHIHNLDYAAVAVNDCVSHDCMPAHNSDPSNPDNNVSTVNGALAYDYDGSGPQAAEPMIIDTTNGAVPHIEDPVTVGVTQFNIYQYVTWVDDPTIAPSQNTLCPDGHTQTCDYKRVVVVVTWKYPVQSGTAHTVTQSTFISTGKLILPTPTPTPTPGVSPLPTASPSPTPTPTATPTGTPLPPQCNAASPPQSPSLVLLSGTGAQQGYTNSSNAQVQLKASDNCAPITADLSNDGTHWTTIQTPLTSGVALTVSWSMIPGDGTKTIYARFRNGAGALTSVLSGSLILDTTVPSIPGNLRIASISCSGSTRSTTMTWNSSSDANLLGYRLYESVGGASYSFDTSTSSASVTWPSKKTDVVNYEVRSYDKAGNESGNSNVLTLAKSQGC